LYSCCRLTLNTHFLLPIANGKALLNSYNYQKPVDELPHTFARPPRRSQKYGNGTARKSTSRRKSIIDMWLVQDDPHIGLNLKKKSLPVINSGREYSVSYP
jgi:hypothetical protein